MTRCNFLETGCHALEAQATNGPGAVITAPDNWWGTTDSLAVDSLVYDHSDDPAAPAVVYWPVATEPFDIDQPTPVLEPDSPPALPQSMHLAQNYPNPFNPSTTIAFDLPRTARVRLEVFNVLGRRVASLIDHRLRAGSHQVVWDASGAATGIYFYRLATESLAITRKMILLR